MNTKKKAIYCAIDNKKQKRIKKIVKRLNEMPPQDVFMLARILKV